jgi:hypothetical protein
LGSAAGGFLLGRPNRGLLLALGRFGRILKLGCRRFVGLLLRGGGTLLRSLRCGALPLFGSRPRFLDFTLCHCARVFLVLDRLVALGLQLVVSLPVVLGRRRVELGRMARRITALKNCLNDLRRQELCLTLRCLSASYRE